MIQNNLVLGSVSLLTLLLKLLQSSFILLKGTFDLLINCVKNVIPKALLNCCTYWLQTKTEEKQFHN